MELRERIPEPELMDSAEQADAYAAADFAGPHDALVALLRERLPGLRSGRVLDLGCGPADVSVRLAQALPRIRVDAVDGAAEMLDRGRERVAAAGLDDRVQLSLLHLPAPVGTWADRGPYDAVVSTSLLHHLGDPAVLWDTANVAGGPGAAVFVWDLRRPVSTEAARALVAAYSGGEPEVLRTDFYNSLCAAYTADEVRAQIAAAGLGLEVEAVGDRHLAVWGHT